MKGALSKLIKLTLQIGGVISTLIAISVVRVLLQRGYRLEVYALTVGMILLLILSWVIRAWLINKKELKNKQSELFNEPTNVKSNSIRLHITTLIIGFIFLLGIVGSLFYWFQIRPSGIRVECNTTAKDKANATSDPIKSYNAFYESCLHGKGI